jgi:hypothetical protein
MFRQLWKYLSLFQLDFNTLIREHDKVMVKIMENPKDEIQSSKRVNQ